MMTAEQLIKIQKLIGVEIDNKALLERAFTHSSKLTQGAMQSNENLEFFGDSILEFIISKKLYGMLESKTHEGDMSKVRASLVSEQTLLEIVDKLKIKDYLDMAVPKNHKMQIGRKCYSDLFEALVATIYIDKGFDIVEKFVLKCYECYLSVDGIKKELNNDYKTRLQEYCQSKKMTIEYKTIGRKGDPLNPIHFVELYISGKKISCGEGAKVKTAQKQCAKLALEKLLKE